MRIDPVATASAQPVRRTASSSGKSDAFARALSGQQGSASVAASVSINALCGVLAAQEVGDALDDQGRAKKRGEEMLDELELIRLGLIDGSIPRARLQALAALARARRGGFNDPRLSEILDHIELRAAVELAKLGY
jgi:hypothetical protein